MLPQAKTQQGLPGSPEARKESGAGSAQGLQRGRGPANALTLDPELPNLQENEFLLSPAAALVPAVVPALEGECRQRDGDWLLPRPDSAPVPRRPPVPRARRLSFSRRKGTRGQPRVVCAWQRFGWPRQARAEQTCHAPEQLRAVTFVFSPSLLLFTLQRLPRHRPCHCAPSVLLFAIRRPPLLCAASH